MLICVDYHVLLFGCWVIWMSSVLHTVNVIFGKWNCGFCYMVLKSFHIFVRQAINFVRIKFQTLFSMVGGGLSPISILLTQSSDCFESTSHMHGWGVSQRLGKTFIQNWRQCFSGSLLFGICLSFYQCLLMPRALIFQKDGRVYTWVLTVPGLVIPMACFQCKFIEYYSSSLLKVIHSNFRYLGLTTNN